MATDIAPSTTVLDLSYAELAAWLKERGEPAFRANQIFQGVYRDLATDYEQVTTLPKVLRVGMATELPLVAPVVVRELHSRDQRTVKLCWPWRTARRSKQC